MERLVYMSRVNLGSNFVHRVTVRLNDDQYNFLLKVSEILGVSPSEYLRMSINSGMVVTKSDVFSESLLKGMVGTNEDVKTDIDNKL